MSAFLRYGAPSLTRTDFADKRVAVVEMRQPVTIEGWDDAFLTDSYGAGICWVMQWGPPPP